MRRAGYSAGLVLAAFSGALTVLPWMHTLHHRDDHVHVDGAIVFLDHAYDHGDVDHDADGEHADEPDDDEGAPGFDHPAHHQGPHGRGALAHGAAFILAGAVFLFPLPFVAREPWAPPAQPGEPTLASQRAPRVTRGPPRAARS